MKNVCRIFTSCLPRVALAGGLPIPSLLIGSCLYPSFALGLITSAHAFEGRITAALTRSGESQTFTYTVGTNALRIERNETDRPYPGNLVPLKTGDITLLLPHNRSFIRLKAPSESVMPGALPMSLPGGGLPPGLGPTNLPFMPNLPNPQMPQMPAAPPMPTGFGTGPPTGMPSLPTMPLPEGPLELKATGEKANFLNYACSRYEIKQRGETMEIWATDSLLPFQPWLQKRYSRFRSRLLEECWGDLMNSRRLFPLQVTLKSENGTERMRFEVNAIVAEKIDDADGSLFQIPPGYHELE